MRVRNRSNSRERLENSPLVFLQPKDNKGKWKNIFGNNNPIHLEIGSGKGKFIHTLAEKYPNINFIAMESQQTVLSFLLDKIEETYRDNLKLISGNAEDLLDYFAPFEISKLYLNFSDPWPKTRHEKRRLTFSKFLERYEIILNNKKTIVQKTDNQGLFEYSLMSFAKNDFTFEKISLDLTNSIYEEDNVHTEYEDKFIQKGNKIYMVEAVKEN
ncbi:MULTISPECIES: tRNA (guanosine(46)-N7)-methyltransferase TrmB [Gemella]|uniref:tRNA (guanosine(46)-N7)-methyltransferase TrmB n=1 Tax=Gemella TaxID=1378 RepID=UPI000767FAA4|nr:MULTISPECIES: tRNA (guanosine(46)-N7)-methyltransferase TrmB [Gemella]AME09468.1 tRNA (guanine-N7)-methyltransferase [Gemella sp. oral taxon 928]AXI27108.1 tRNA (guanosine(46)-N7)-methyltransferase TrmB [Gemella sp. ND 6198]